MGDGGRSRNAVLLRRGHELAEAQSGVLRRAQLQDLGASPGMIRRWVDAGLWVAHGRSVLTLPGLERNLRTRSLIVAQRLPTACLTGASALAVRGLLDTPPWDALRDPDEVWVIHPHRVSVPARVLRRQPDGSDKVLGVSVARSPAVMLDLLRFLPPRDARDLAYRAIGAFQWEGFMRALAATAEEHRHQPGVHQLRDIARRVGDGARSEAERILHQLLRRAGVTGWRANHAVVIRGRKYLIDVAFPDEMLAIEVDGRAYHGHDRFQQDRTRQNALVGAGWLVLRFTWEDLTERPDEVLRIIAAARSDRA